MAYKVEFPQDAGQFAGVHTFFSKSSMTRFLEKAKRLGYTVFKVLK